MGRTWVWRIERSPPPSRRAALCLYSAGGQYCGSSAHVPMYQGPHAKRCAVPQCTAVAGQAKFTKRNILLVGPRGRCSPADQPTSSQQEARGESDKRGRRVLPSSSGLSYEN
jgi:hypothetical protein